MRIKITINTDNSVDLLALKVLVEHYLSQPAIEPMDEAELVELIREKTDNAKSRMQQIMAEKLYGSYQSRDNINPAGAPLTADWDRYR